MDKHHLWFTHFGLYSFQTTLRGIVNAVACRQVSFWRSDVWSRRVMRQQVFAHRTGQVACKDLSRKRRCVHTAAAERSAELATRTAGPGDAPTDYKQIDQNSFNRLIMSLFRRKMVDAIGQDSSMSGYDGIIDLTRTLNAKYTGAALPVSLRFQSRPHSDTLICMTSLAACLTSPIKSSSSHICKQSSSSSSITAARPVVDQSRALLHCGMPPSLVLLKSLLALASARNLLCADPRKTQLATRSILNSLFPSWLPPAFKVMFAKPLPGFSNKLNAWVTALTCQWLMGPSKVNDAEQEDGTVLRRQGVLIERCAHSAVICK